MLLAGTYPGGRQKMIKTIGVLSLVLIVVALAGCYGLGGVSQPTSQERETGRSYLVGHQPEKTGYGLYSYILFGSPPTTATHKHYFEAINAYMTIPPMSGMEAYLPREQLNITYLLLEDSPPPEFERCLRARCTDGITGLAEWVIAHYNYTRARVILRALPGTQRDGPYIVSYFKPLSDIKSLSGKYLYQDLSSAPPTLVLSWVKEFLNQAAQEHYWEQRTAMQLVLNLRTAIEILAEGLPEVQAALDEWIAWIH